MTDLEHRMVVISVGFNIKVGADAGAYRKRLVFDCYLRLERFADVLRFVVDDNNFCTTNEIKEKINHRTSFAQKLCPMRKPSITLVEVGDA